MARVTLNAIWVNVAADPSIFRQFYFVTAFSRSVEKRVEVRQLAGGRLRSISQAGKRRMWTLGLQALTQVDKRWIEDHVGTTLCFRDDRGNKVFGQYGGSNIEEHLYNAEGDTSLTVHEVTWTEESTEFYVAPPSALFTDDFVDAF